MSRAMFVRTTGLVFAVMLLAACSSDSDSDGITIVDEDTGIDIRDAGDTAPPDGTSQDGFSGDTSDTGRDWPPESKTCHESSAVAIGEGQPVETGNWVSANRNTDGEPIRPSIRFGEFSVPEAGTSAHGVTWSAVEPKETGVFEGSEPPANSIGWAATTIEVDEPKVLVAKMHGIYEMFAGGTPYPGDVYGDNYLMPVPLEPGSNQIVVRYTGRSTPRLTLTEAPGDIAVDTADASYPNLRVGHQRDLPLGIQALNLSGESLTEVEAQVVENEHFEASTRSYPAMGADTRNQLGFELVPKHEWSEAGKEISVKLRIDACELEEAYEFTYTLKTKAADSTFRQTYISPVDGSVQYYGVRPPKNYTAGQEYGMVMALHGAGVDGGGLVGSYSTKEWAWIISPTSRRPFGFNWEEWGHFNALASLKDAKSRWAVNENRVHITGHSMGGHGTWHVSIHNPDKFATIVPSAGWESIYSYPPGGGSERPEGVLGRSRAHSDTQVYLPNLEDRSIYVIHGEADNNVPTSEGRKMCNKAEDLISDPENVECHFEPGAEHWWDGDAAEGTDCVDWPAAWEMMRNTTFEPNELDFEYRTPGPWYGPTHSYVKIDSSETPMEDVELASTKTSDTNVELTTTNARSLEIDGEVLTDKGIETIDVDGESHDVPDGTLRIGPETGKTAEQHGPLNQVYRSPFCFVYSSTKSDVYRKYATWLASTWSVRGNGYACAMPYWKFTDEIRENRNIIYVGVDPERANLPEDRPFSWDGQDISIGDQSSTTLAAVTVFPEGDGMAAAAYGRPENENILLHPLFKPFASRRGMPDYLMVTVNSQQDAETHFGFYDATWQGTSELRD